jgi:hypothetical protein
MIIPDTNDLTVAEPLQPCGTRKIALYSAPTGASLVARVTCANAVLARRLQPPMIATKRNAVNIRRLPCDRSPGQRSVTRRPHAEIGQNLYFAAIT